MRLDVIAPLQVFTGSIDRPEQSGRFGRFGRLPHRVREDDRIEFDRPANEGYGTDRYRRLIKLARTWSVAHKTLRSERDAHASRRGSGMAPGAM